MGRYEKRLSSFLAFLMAFDTHSTRRLTFGPSTTPQVDAAAADLTLAPTLIPAEQTGLVAERRAPSRCFP